MKLFDRQRLLLTMLNAIGGRVSNTDFQKLLFLYTHECEQKPSYEFVPYKFGGFSFTSYADKRRLTEAGLLTNDDQQWELTATGQRVARTQAILPLEVGRFCRQHASLRGNALIAEQYRKYPYYATRSEIVGKVLLDAESRQRVAHAHPAKAKPGLLTIGYEGRSLEAFLNLLLKNSATLLCDVRRNPISRKYGFSKTTLSNVCVGVGIRYEHLPELGIDSEERCDLKTQADYDALFLGYKRTCLPRQKETLAKVREWINSGERVALTCFELLPQQCHRHCVAEALERAAGKSLMAVHL
jgi:hypothetical protein